MYTLTLFVAQAQARVIYCLLLLPLVCKLLRITLISLFLFFSTILKTIDMEELLLLQQVAPHVIIKNAM